ncbi:hypothetical protein [Geminocystis sp. NIES-3709]|uniref:hypothetical protein n=1 Tax=Geminocystis sp. NIES-3709 TaxID=1617448 RepID=UPI0005FCA1A9|nr:hypothetical protein [Geminocystis sp. NIES-3709]BAQ67161.1 hypothetical protein GM3709_3926 [Geminocystis sp. NIES-3709]
MNCKKDNTEGKKILQQNCKPEKQDSSDRSSLKDLVDEYRKKYENSYKLENAWWGNKKLTWEEAIKRAWESKLPDGKMHSHQYHVAKYLPDGLEIALADSKKPKDFKDFESLHNWVKSIVDRVHGLGPVTAYDVAQRLGLRLELEPSMVYLHAGTREGAKKLGIDGDVVLLSDFPKEIQSLVATHAENFLCLYKNCLTPNMK